MNDTEKKKFKKALLFVTAVIILYTLITNVTSLGGYIVSFFSLFSPLFFGIVLSMLLGAPMRKFEQLFRFLNRKSGLRRKLSEKMITVISLILTFVLAFLLIYFVGNSVFPAIGSSFRNIFSSIEEYYPKALSYLESYGLDTSDMRELLGKINFDEIWTTLTSNAGKILQTAMSTVSGVFSLLVNLVSSVIFAIYILANRNNLRRQFGKLLHAYFRPKTAGKVQGVFDLIFSTFSKFFTGQCVEAVVLGTIFFIAMSIFGFPYALVISVIIAITALVPYVGAFLGCAVGVVLILMESPMRALIFVAMFLIIQQLENQLIYPRVVGTSVGLPAMWTFAALIAGGAIYGVIGMLIFIPMTSVIYTLLKNDVNHRLKKKYGSSELLGEKLFAAADMPEDSIPKESEHTSEA